MKLHGTRIIIPHGDGRLPLRVARCLGAEGGRFILLSGDVTNVARRSRYCESFVHTPDNSDAALLHRLAELGGGTERSLVLPVTTEGFEFVSRHRETLAEQFHVPPIAAVNDLRVASDKWALYTLAQTHDLPVLRSIPLTQCKAMMEANDPLDLEFPLLIKTRRREGGSGFIQVDREADLSPVVSRLSSEEIEGAFVQRLVQGIDVSLSAYCEDGEIRAHTLWEAVSYGRKRFQIPRCIRFRNHPRALEIGRRLLKVLNWRGVCDIDLLEDADTGALWLLEVNARFWGNVVGCAWAGVNFPALLCQRARDERPTWPVQSDRVYCYPKGVPGIMHRRDILGEVIRHPFGCTGGGHVLRDLGPEFFKLFLHWERWRKKRRAQTTP